MRLIPWLAATAAVLAACGDTTTDDPPVDDDSSAVTYYADVKPILDAKCVQCHFEGGIAPFSLETYDDAKIHAGISKLAIHEGIMPPWPPEDDCAEYHGDRSLTQAQIDTFTAWQEAGSPEGDPSAEGEPLPDNERGLSRVDQTLAMAESYTPRQTPDDYRCFLIPWPEEYTNTAYVTGFGAVPGNDQIVHHVIAFLATPDQVATYEQMDAAEDGPGYTCFGGTGGPARGWLGGWAPGGLGSDLPPGTGLPVQPGSMVILQVHYNTLTVEPQSDLTSIELKIDSEVEREARILPWANPQWLSTSTMHIPANEADVMHEFALDPTAFLGGGAYEIHSAALHMHTLGKSGVLTVERGDGGSDCLLQIDDWDFDWQGSYELAAPRRIEPGDQLRIECHWDNTLENQPMVDGQPKVPTDVYWGEGTTDEMCLGIFLITEAQ